MGAAAIPYLVTALGAGIGAREQYNAARRTDREAARGILAQSQHQREADARIGELTQGIAGSSPEAERAAAMDQFMQQLSQNRAGSINAGGAGARSDAFNAASGEAQAAVQNYGQRAADVLARISAAGRQRQNEGELTGRAATDLGIIGRNADADAFIAQLRAQNAGRTNPWMEGLGQALQAGGSAMAGRLPPGKLTDVSGAANRAVEQQLGGGRQLWGSGALNPIREMQQRTGVVPYSPYGS